MAPKNIKIIPEGRTLYRLHRRPPQEYNEDSFWTAGFTCFSMAIGQTLSRDDFLDVMLRESVSSFCPRLLEYSLEGLSFGNPPPPAGITVVQVVI
jgi:hypothetical protein